MRFGMEVGIIFHTFTKYPMVPAAVLSRPTETWLSLPDRQRKSTVKRNVRNESSERDD